MTKLCKDCHWYKSHDYYNTGSGFYDECLCPDIPHYKNTVTGGDIVNSCIRVRLDSSKCGEDGKYWMERQPPETKEGFWNRVFNFGNK